MCLEARFWQRFQRDRSGSSGDAPPLAEIVASQMSQNAELLRPPIMSRRVVIVGAGYAGVLCAARLSRRLKGKGKKGQVAIVDPRTHFVERVRLHEDAATGTIRPRISL